MSQFKGAMPRLDVGWCMLETSHDNILHTARCESLMPGLYLEEMDNMLMATHIIEPGDANGFLGMQLSPAARKGTQLCGLHYNCQITNKTAS